MLSLLVHSVYLHMAELNDIILTEEERNILTRRTRSQKASVADARRAQAIVMLADGYSYLDIQHALGCDDGFITRWKRRFLVDRIDGLVGQHRGSKPSVLTPKLQARILEETRKGPADGTSHWSTRRLGKKLGVSHMIVATAWRKAGYQPHRMRRYMTSDDPDFETKAADVIALYVNPPQNAVVFSVDEKTAIQALDRVDPMLPMTPGRAERHGFEYRRCGTLSLFGALNTQTGQVIGVTAPRHTTEEFVSFLELVVSSEPVDREIHIILDNLSTHKTRRVKEFRADHPNVYFHFTPTYSSWLNQIEIWFSKLERQVLARGIFTSPTDLAKTILRYIKRSNRDAKPFKWRYTNVKHRITSKITNTVN